MRLFMTTDIGRKVGMILEDMILNESVRGPASDDYRQGMLVVYDKLVRLQAPQNAVTGLPIMEVLDIREHGHDSIQHEKAS